MQQTLEKIGKQVFYKRLQQKMTQEELCQGICSVSYLSKIENGKIEASEEILQLLCARLEIAVTDLRDVEEDVKGKLEDWHKAIVHLERERIEQIYADLQEQMEQVTDFEIMNYYELLYVRYLMIKRDIDNGVERLNKLKKGYKKLSPFQKMLFTYNVSLLNCLQNKWKIGLESLIETEKMAKELNYHENGIYYNLALAYSHLENPYKALHFANIAIEGFRSEYKFRNVINCQFIIAICFVRQGQYKEALDMYNSILREASSFSENKVIMSIALSNIAEVYGNQKQYEKAKEYYLKSLQYHQHEDDNYLDTLYHTALQCIHLKQMDEANQWIEKGISIAQRHEKHKRVLYLLIILQYKYFRTSDEYKKFLELEAIPFFKSEGNLVYLKQVYLEIAHYFEGIRNFEESSRYYKETISLLEKGEEK